jgi:hypothetical protein
VRRKVGSVTTADVHMERWPYVDRRKLEWDAKFGLEQVVDKAVELDAEWLFLLGDNFNVRHPSGEEVETLLRQTHRASKAHINTGFIQGQHCWQRTPWPLLVGHLDERTYWLHKQTIQMSGHRVYGLDWTNASDLPGELAQVPKDTDVLLMHQVWHDLCGEQVHPEVASKDIPANIRLLMTGDFHDHRSMSLTNAGGKRMAFLSPGPVCMQNLAEPARKLFYVIYDDLSFDSVPLKSRNCLRYLLRTKEDLDTFIAANVTECVTPQEGVPDYIAMNAVEVRYYDDIPECRPRLLAVLDKKCHHFLKPVTVAAKNGSQEIDVPALRALSLAEAIQKVPEVSQEAKDAAVRLVTCKGNLVDELSLIKNEFFNKYKKERA